MKAFVVFLLLVQSVQTDCGARYFASPTFIIKTIQCTSRVMVPELAKVAIQYKYHVSHFLIDCSCHAVYAGATRGPQKIPHALVEYACVEQLYQLINTIGIIRSYKPGFIKDYRSLQMLFWAAKPCIIKAVLRTIIEGLVDSFLSEEATQED